MFRLAQSQVAKAQTAELGGVGAGVVQAAEQHQIPKAIGRRGFDHLEEGAQFVQLETADQSLRTFAPADSKQRLAVVRELGVVTQQGPCQGSEGCTSHVRGG
jgi:hypothetical protein